MCEIMVFNWSLATYNLRLCKGLSFIVVIHFLEVGIYSHNEFDWSQIAIMIIIQGYIITISFVSVCIIFSNVQAVYNGNS